MVAPLSFFGRLSEHASRKMRVNDSYARLSSEDVRILMLNVSIEINMNTKTLLSTNTNPPLNVLIVVSDKIGFEFSLIPQPRCALD